MSNLKGVLSALAAFAVFSVHDVVVKFLGGQYSPFQIIFFANAEPPELVEDKIFEGFYSKADENLLRIFHGETWANKYAMIEKLEDERLKELALRIVILNCPELVPTAKVEEFRQMILRRWSGEEFYGDNEKNLETHFHLSKRIWTNLKTLIDLK